MPIYEFYCGKCHTIYSFYSRIVNTEKTPMCPVCKREDVLSRRISPFSVISGKAQNEDQDDFDLPVSEGEMEHALGRLASEAEGIDENDPGAAAGLMRRLSEMTGLKYSKKMEEAIDMIESCNDPETAQEKIGDIMDGEDNPFVLPGKTGLLDRLRPPKRDDALYEM